MPAYYLEALTVTLGIILLMAEAFCSCKSKSWIGIAAVAGLTVILGLLFISVGQPLQGGIEIIGGSRYILHLPETASTTWPLWNFYQFDSLAKFYKGFALVCTILVLLMAVDFRKI